MIKVAILSWVAFAITVLLLRIIASASKDLWIWKATDKYPPRIYVTTWIIIILFIVAVITSVITIIRW